MKEIGKWYGKIAAVSIVINMVIEAISRKSVFEMFHYLGADPMIFLLNALMIALPFTLLFLTKRKSFMMIICSLVWLLAGLGNGFLLSFRTTPFTAADLRVAKYGLSLITTYMTWQQIVLLIVGMGLVTVLCCIVWKKAPISNQKLSYPRGLLLVGMSTALVVGATKISMNLGLVAVRFGNIGQAYQDYGFAYCFSNSLLNTGISKPDSYGSEAVASIEEEMVPENTYRLAEHKTPNIIMVQLESFFDPTLYKNYSFEKDPIPFFRYLKRSFPSGYLNVPSVGAGTANTEFECITGMNLDFFGPGEYPYKTILQKTTCESMAFNMKTLGYTAHAIHNNEATFYDRNKVFAQFGFDTFTPIEYMYRVERNQTGWCKDEILVDEIVKTLDSTKTQDFIYTISVQGHGAYPSFEYYCQQIHEMDNFIKKLIYTMNKRQEPTVVVFYGDHLPSFPWQEQDMKNASLYQTPYVIWNNLDLKAVKREVEAYQLTSYLLNLLDIHEGTMIRYHQSYMKEKDADPELYLANMKVLEYDMLYGDHEIYDGGSPYTATELTLGILPIEIDSVVYHDSNLLLFGENFNEYSKVYLDEKAVETMYVWPQLLIVKDLPEKKMRRADLSVRQVGKDKVVLGEVKFDGFIQ
ncbi:MAG: sulfatase-like hydrolase/transferase [Hungatella sp.]